MSAADLLAVLIDGHLALDFEQPDDPRNDHLIFSKGHASPLFYSLWLAAGRLSEQELETYRQFGSPLEGHPNYRRLPGVEASTGSLGQGLSIGIGHALAARLDDLDYRVFVMMGDGENAEGQVWEAIMSAPKFRLDNLIAIVDQNGYQQTGATKDVLDLKPLPAKYEAFGWFTQEINGHNFAEVIGAFNKALANKNRPSAIIARTVKGYPIQDLIGDPNHHGKPLTRDQADRALAYLDSH
jgi:transketolase